MSEVATGFLEGPDTVRVFYRAWETPGPVGCVLCVHGLGEHGGRYQCLADAIAPLGLSLYAIDMRGHGRSAGRRGHVVDFDSLLGDVDRLRVLAGGGRGDRPLFLVGHSLGGLVVGRYAQSFAPDGLEGVVFVAPFVDVAMDVPNWKRRLGDVADRLVPALTMDNGLEVEELFREEAERSAYTGDPLVHRRISARLWGEMQRSARKLTAEADRLRVPALLQLAGTDTVVSNPAARRFAARLVSPPEIREYGGAYHALFRDPRGPEALEDLRQWLAGRLGQRGGAARRPRRRGADTYGQQEPVESTVEDR